MVWTSNVLVRGFRLHRRRRIMLILGHEIVTKQYRLLLRFDLKNEAYDLITWLSSRKNLQSQPYRQLNYPGFISVKNIKWGRAAIGGINMTHG